MTDPVPRELRADAEKVVTEAIGELGDRVGPELTRYQVETRTDPHTSLAELADQIHATRHSLARAAVRQGLRIISSGTPVLAPPGPPPHFESPSHFEDLVAGLLATGAIMDRGGLYWDIRPSHHLPTLEFRAADATATAEDTALES
ncbi:hypothetical protein DEJ50_05035 [Streptomyces venezuelae]|uniref:Uncharacterized protein n=1 Tax=Streptomyces venezuelae TaxID=54571 RepID=A0A5P2CWR0_STRVZ|nr:glutamate-cysteine ligase family protein [Streptomyces venezuelae]QES47285.1 hypothetical protein DEJ50_05035 [Streptomyces venezuelae]